MVLNPHIESCRDCSFLQISVNVEVLFVGSALSQFVNQLRITVESKHNRFVLGEKQVKLFVGKAVRMINV